MDNSDETGMGYKQINNMQHPLKLIQSITWINWSIEADRLTYVRSLALLLANFVNLYKLIFSELQFPHLHIGQRNIHLSGCYED